jgi:hypothetical protein
MSIINTFKNFSFSGFLFFIYLTYDSIKNSDPIENTIFFSLFSLVFICITFFVFNYIKTNLKSIIFKNVILWIFVAIASNI